MVRCRRSTISIRPRECFVARRARRARRPAPSLHVWIARRPNDETPVAVRRAPRECPTDNSKKEQLMAKEILVGFGIDVDAVAGWLGSYGGDDSPDDISRRLVAGQDGSLR